MVLGAVSGHHLSGGQDFASMVGAVTAMAAGFFVARRISSNPDRKYEPRLVKVTSSLADALT